MDPLLTGLIALAAAVAGAIATILIEARRTRAKSIIEERQKWRDTLRSLVPDLLAARTAADREHLRDAIALLLNPYDRRDQDALTAIDAYVHERSDIHRTTITDLFQDILKRDWERAKIEASRWPWCAMRRADARTDKAKARSDRSVSD